jgi:heme/copper-type cytochrome/quinol oxidase subunit 1
MSPPQSQTRLFTTLGLPMNEAQSKVVWACIGGLTGAGLAAFLFNRTLKNTYEQFVPLQVRERA